MQSMLSLHKPSDSLMDFMSDDQERGGDRGNEKKELCSDQRLLLLLFFK